MDDTEEGNVEFEVNADELEDDLRIYQDRQDRVVLNKKEELATRLNDIMLPEHIRNSFIETLTLVNEEDDEVDLENIDVNDDLATELAMYKLALKSVKASREKFKEMNIDYFRPKDYYADMVKSDELMSKVRQKLLFEKQKMETFEQRKKAQEYRKNSKQLQAQKIKEKSAKKRKNIQDVDQYTGGRPTKGRKRLAKDKRYGYGGGGKKSLRKRNDRESTNEYNKPGQGNKRGKKRRPGKNQRIKNKR
jgi:rRNA-processing protein EBP2